MADQAAQEKTEKATPRKLQKARTEGQVARSMELNSVIIVTFGFLTIYFLGPMLFDRIGGLMTHSFSQAPYMVITPARVAKVFSNNMMTYALIVGPILLIVGIFAYAINVSQVGFMLSIKSIEPKLDRFNIVKGFGRVFSKRSMIHMIRDIFKTAVIAIVAYQTISGWMPDIIQIGDQSAAKIMSVLGRLALMLALKISAVLLVLAFFDFAFQRWDFANKQKMTKQEVKEEMKDTDGNPLLKSRIRQVQREMARQRMMSEIPDADVVVTNPTHIAVALKYNLSEMSAPKVVAKGQRLIAEKIKQIAKEHGIPVVENKPLARSLFKLVDVGNFIPAELYRTVAEVLAHIYRLKEGGVVNG